MSNLLYQYTPWYSYLKKLNLSERVMAAKASISRSTWRKIAAGDPSVELSRVLRAAEALNLDLILIAAPKQTRSECSTVACAINVMHDGPDSWKIHFMNLVDQFRREPDPHLVLLPPPAALHAKLKGLLASIVVSLCDEAKMETPAWARRRYELPVPWFVSGMESLKATALLESPLAFRRNNIFVISNFLERA